MKDLMAWIYTVCKGVYEIILQLLKEWGKARTVFTAMFYVAFIYLILKGLTVPPELNTIISTLFGYWFGQKQSAKQNGNGGEQK